MPAPAETELEKKSSVDPKNENTRTNYTIVIFKIMLFIICITGFTFQASEFLAYYWTYPTVIELRLERHKDFIAPAFTYCHVRSATKNNYCLKYPGKCYTPEKNDTNCALYPDYCKNNFQLPYLDSLNDNNTDINMEDLLDLKGNIGNFMYWNPWDFNESDIRGPFFYTSWWSYNISVCYIANFLVESNKTPKTMRIDTPNLKNDFHERLFMGYIGFNLQSEVMYENEVHHGVTLQVHSPFYAAVPDKKLTMRPGNRYELHIRLEEEHLLPYPYGTDCINYTLVWERNNRTGPRSEKMCKELCEVRYESACVGCVNVWNVYPTSTPKCMKGDVDTDEVCNKTLKKEHDDCVSHCKMECSKTKYIYTIVEKEKDPWDYRGYTPGIIEVDVFVEPQALVYTHRAQFQSVELFSYLGGYMGIWLGISLFALWDMLQSAFFCSKLFLEQKLLSRSKKEKDNTAQA